MDLLIPYVLVPIFAGQRQYLSRDGFGTEIAVLPTPLAAGQPGSRTRPEHRYISHNSPFQSHDASYVVYSSLNRHQWLGIGIRTGIKDTPVMKSSYANS